MSGYRVSIEELDNVIQRLQSFQQSLDEHFAQADNQSRQLCATWSGTAASAHHEAHARWRTGARDMYEALEVMRSAARTAHENYTAAGETNRSMWQL